MILIISCILFYAYACCEGHKEAYLYYYRNQSAGDINFGPNLHSEFALQRIIAWLPIEYINFDPSNYWTLLNGICIALSFTFFHDGVYYWKRNKLDKSYPLGFFDQSTTSTSWLDKLNLTNPIMRIIYFGMGVFGLIIINYAIC